MYLLNKANILNCENLKLDFGTNSTVSFGQLFLTSKEKHCIGPYYLNGSVTATVILSLLDYNHLV